MRELVAGALRAGTSCRHPERLELDSSFTSLFPELEAALGAVSQLADLPFLP